MMVESPISEKEWQSRYDADTLSNAEIIKADQDRLNAAQAAAKKMADEKAEEKVAMDKVARTGGRGNAAPNNERAPTKAANTDFSPPRGGTAGKRNQYNVFQRLNKG
jgi:hypothetical protein